MNQPFLNPSGYMVKNCVECKRDINLNSFSKEDNNLCSMCYEDINDVKVYGVVTGDYNDVFSKDIVKGTWKQVEEYLLSHFDDFGDRKEDIEDIDFGFELYYEPEINPETDEPFEDQEALIEFYAQADIIEDYNEDKYGKIDIDLTNEENNNGA